MPLTTVGSVMAWGEAVRLAQVLMRDPASHVCAAINGWESPRSREWFIIADLFDLTHAVNSKRQPKPYPRPGDIPQHFGKTDLSNDQVFAVLRRHGHDIN
jgi:hypothetical protein